MLLGRVAFVFVVFFGDVDPLELGGDGFLRFNIESSGVSGGVPSWYNNELVHCLFG